MLVGELERHLLDLISDSVAEPWDRTGMLVGDPSAEVTGVAIALDPTIAAIDFASGCNANVLVTHHPLFLDPPCEIKPAGSGHDVVGARVWRAIEAGVSVISFHTALDANPIASDVLAKNLGLVSNGELLEEAEGHQGYGYGRICNGDGRTVKQLADCCAKAFGRLPRVWGDVNREARRICLWTGAAGEAPGECIERDIDMLVCGEVKYHAALDACERGLCIIELGHDVSEQPHCAVLVESVRKCGIGAGHIHLMELPANWR